MFLDPSSLGMCLLSSYSESFHRNVGFVASCSHGTDVHRAYELLQMFAAVKAGVEVTAELL